MRHYPSEENYICGGTPEPELADPQAATKHINTMAAKTIINLLFFTDLLLSVNAICPLTYRTLLIYPPQLNPSTHRIYESAFRLALK